MTKLISPNVVSLYFVSQSMCLLLYYLLGMTPVAPLDVRSFSFFGNHRTPTLCFPLPPIVSGPWFFWFLYYLGIFSLSVVTSMKGSVFLSLSLWGLKREGLWKVRTCSRRFTDKFGWVSGRLNPQISLCQVSPDGGHYVSCLLLFSTRESRLSRSRSLRLKESGSR